MVAEGSQTLLNWMLKSCILLSQVGNLAFFEQEGQKVTIMHQAEYKDININKRLRLLLRLPFEIQ